MDTSGSWLFAVPLSVQPLSVSERIDVFSKDDGKTVSRAGLEGSSKLPLNAAPATDRSVSYELTKIDGWPPVALIYNSAPGAVTFEFDHRKISGEVSTHRLHTPANECVIPSTLLNVQLPVEQPFGETVRFAEGFVSALMMLIFTVGSISIPGLCPKYGNCAVVFPSGRETFSFGRVLTQRHGANCLLSKDAYGDGYD